MNSNKYNSNYQILANHLHRNFVANHWVHAEQRPDGKYSTVHKPLGIARIESLLLNGESCLTYQLSSGALRWVCFDIDIKREILDREDYPNLKNEAESEVMKISSLLCAYLTEKNIPFLLEFSGNRGAHVWVLWNEFVVQHYGYAFQQKVLDGSQVLKECKFTAIDRFPQTPRSNGKLGKGVKLPLSKHQKSGFYACLVSSLEELEKRFNSPFLELDNHTITEQSKILRSFRIPTWSEITGGLALNSAEIESISAPPPYIRNHLSFSPEKPPTLDSVINSLGECTLLRPMTEKCISNEQLSEKERAILVGLLRQLKLPGKLNLGKELLFELFGRQPNFNPNLTKAKLSNLNLYPPTCSYLSETFAINQTSCDVHKRCKGCKSPIELLDGCEVVEDTLFALTPEKLEVIRVASLRYAEINDEIDLEFLRADLEGLDSAVALDSFHFNLARQRVLGQYYTFERPESTDRIRKLVSLGAYDAVLSAWFTKILDGLFGAEVSTHSYGYRFEPSLSSSNLFKHWLPQWHKYTNSLDRIIKDDAFDNYWVVKIDIRTFYDQISLTRLRNKLGSGPTPACGATLQSLNDKSRNNYDVICSTLVEWCRVISGGDRGVPQGPAFARYLAELYLMQFDQDVESLMVIHQAQYFRLVDDIFLITPCQKSAETIDGVIRGEIDALSLEIHEGKAFLGTVKYYRLRFQDYKDDSKYFVDHVSRQSRTSSSALNAQAREVLDEIIEDYDHGEIRPENAAFYLTHLQTSPQSAERLIPELLKVEHGRGSFFKHLFDYIVRDLRECEFATEKWDLSGLTGLRLESFLNSLLRMLREEPLTPRSTENLETFLKKLQSRPQSQISKSLLIHLMLNDSNLSELLEMDDHLSIGDLIQCLGQSNNIEISDKVLNAVLGHLTRLPAEESIELLYVLVLENRLSKAGYTRSSDSFFSVILDQLKQEGDASPTINCLSQSNKGSGELLKKYHTLCCLCFIAATDKNSEEFSRVWYALISLTNDISHWNPGKAYWLEKSDCININPVNLSVLITAIIGGDGVCLGKTDTHKIFEDYHYNLVVFLFSFFNRNLVESLPEKADLIREAKDHGMLYLEWLLDTTSDVALYPNKKVCLRNIVENELTILKRGDELLVRHPSKPGFTSPPPGPQLICSTDESSSPPFSNSVYRSPVGSVELDRLIQETSDLGDVIRLITKIFKNLCQIRDDHSESPMGLANVFLEGFGLFKETLAPAIPATALGRKILVSQGPQLLSKTNDSTTAWELLLERVKSSDRNLLPYGHHSQVSAESIGSLIPPNISIDAQVEFFDILGDVLPAGLPASPIEVDHTKLVAAAKFSELQIAQNTGSPERRPPTLFGKTIEIYLSITGTRTEFTKRLSLAPVDSPSDQTLGSILDAIRKSLEWTTPHEFLGVNGINLLNSISEDFFGLARAISTSAGEQEANQILNTARRAVLGEGEDYELIVDGSVFISSSGEVVTEAPVTVIHCGGFSSLEEALKPQHSASLRRSRAYSYKTESRTVLFLLDDIIRTVFEVIRKRSEAFNGEGRGKLSAAELECLEDRTQISQDLRNNPFFNKACEVVRRNHFTSTQIRGIDDSERFVLRWLEQFEALEASMLLEVIAAHQYITKGDVTDFVASVTEQKTAGSLLFSTKKISDQGGLHRLFTLTENGQNLIRGLDLDNAAKKIAKLDGSSNTLVILAETILSGGQLKNNFRWHYLSSKPEIVNNIEQERLFEIEEFKEDFVQGLKSFSNILILSAAYAQRGADKLKTYLSTELGISKECIQIKGSKLNDLSCFLEDTKDITAESKDRLSALVKDLERIKSIFQVDDESSYTGSLSKLDRANLLVRPNSVTKMVLKIFTLPSLNVHIPPLFRETKEHN